MSEIFLSITIPILVLSVVVSAIVLGIKAFKEKGKNVFSMSMLWKAYLYVMTLLSLSLFMYGGARFTKAMFAKFTQPYFSYSTNQYSTPIVKDSNVPDYIDPVTTGESKVIEKNGVKYTYQYSEYKSDIIDGLTMFISLAVIFAIHRFLIVKADTEKESFFRRAYNFTGLAQYGVLSVVAIPTAIYDTLKYFIEDINLGNYSRPVPGIALSVLIFALPAWIIFLTKVYKDNKNSK